jgi:hypothetical protein
MRNAGEEAGMCDHDVVVADALDARASEPQMVEFVTAFHSGTGGSRVVLLGDRIVAHYRGGRTSETRLCDIAYAGSCETGLASPAHGVYLVLRTPPYDTGYLFEEAATSRAFLAALRRRMQASATPGLWPGPYADTAATA